MLKMKMSPLSSKIQKGFLSKSSILVIKRLQKIQREDFFYLMIDDFKIIEEPDLQQINRNWIYIKSYRSEKVPLGGKIGTYYWELSTLNEILYLEPFDFNIIQNIPQNQYSKLASLNYLDNNWTNIKSKPTLLVRVLSISKLNIVIQNVGQILLMVNMLVADKSNHCVITAFDDAALHIANSVRENDVLLMMGSYKIGKLKTKYKANKKYQLCPKLRLSISPTEIEIKVNDYDLKYICILNNEVERYVPPATWNFKSVKTLIEGSHSNIRMNDLIGVLICVSRYEREQIYINKKSTSRFHIRIWLAITDNSNGKRVYVKTYFNKNNRLLLSEVVPGDLICITNLLVVNSYRKTSHLTTSNESSIFIAKDFHHPKFSNCQSIIETIRADCLQFNLEKWMKIYESATIGGNICPIRGTLTKNIMNISFDHKYQIINVIKQLPINTAYRFIVKGKIKRLYRIKEILNNSNIQISSSHTTNCFGTLRPVVINLAKLALYN